MVRLVIPNFTLLNKNKDRNTFLCFSPGLETSSVGGSFCRLLAKLFAIFCKRGALRERARLETVEVVDWTGGEIATVRPVTKRSAVIPLRASRAYLPAIGKYDVRNGLGGNRRGERIYCGHPALRLWASAAFRRRCSPSLPAML